MKIGKTTALAICVILTAPLASGVAGELELTGAVRDFKRGDRSGGHPDFETAHTVPGHGDYGLVHGLVSMYLGEDGKPVYNPVRPDNDTVYSAGSLAQWHTDVPDVNMSKPLTITLSNGVEGDGGVYTYENNSFWPIDNELFGNEGLTRNFHFTFELSTNFTYEHGQLFSFYGDDDVWVYINGVKVIDLGGVHSKKLGDVILFDGKAYVKKAHFAHASEVARSLSDSDITAIQNRWEALEMDGQCPINKSDHREIDLQLEDGAECTLHFFFAERHTTQSNFRIDTSISLESNDPPTVSPLYD